MTSADVEGALVVTVAVTIPAAELGWRFSRSSGPGGQSVNTADSRVELSWDVSGSAALEQALGTTARELVLGRLSGRLVGGVLTVVATEHRQQRRNRVAARQRLAQVVREALAPAPPPRRATRPSAGSRRRRVAAEQLRRRTKAMRRQPGRAPDA